VCLYKNWGTPMGKHHVVVCFGSLVAVVALLIQPSAVFAQRGHAQRTEVAAGDTVVIPSSAINEASRIVTVCKTGGSPEIVRRPAKSRAAFRCGNDPKIGMIQCPDKEAKLVRRDGWFCSGP
jgi:hypothetical protein